MKTDIKSDIKDELFEEVVEESFEKAGNFKELLVSFTEQLARLFQTFNQQLRKLMFHCIVCNRKFKTLKDLSFHLWARHLEIFETLKDHFETIEDILDEIEQE